MTPAPMDPASTRSARMCSFSSVNRMKYDFVRSQKTLTIVTGRPEIGPAAE